MMIWRRLDTKVVTVWCFSTLQRGLTYNMSNLINTYINSQNYNVWAIFLQQHFGSWLQKRSDASRRQRFQSLNWHSDEKLLRQLWHSCLCARYVPMPGQFFVLCALRCSHSFPSPDWSLLDPASELHSFLLSGGRPVFVWVSLLFFVDIQ